MNAHTSTTAQRQVALKTRGHGHGPIVRLMSPRDYGKILKPFVFLDIFSPTAEAVGDMPLHPHSGLATITVLTEGDLRFDDPHAGKGTLSYGGVEWMRAGNGVWHGKEMSPGSSPRIKGFQLWIALPQELENGPVDSQYIEAHNMPISGPATIILGEYDGVKSPVRSPEGINYLLVKLEPGQSWTYTPPNGHDVAWLAVSHGAVNSSKPVESGEMAILEGSGPVVLNGCSHGATFVIGSAVPHPYDLVTGHYSVHTNIAALRKGEAHIRELHALLPSQNPTGPTPVFRG